jgi:acetylornithine deacetylase/succinyl-diaminopimelate desuccinylase-like protein
MAEGTAQTAAPAELGAEAVGLLQRLIRADTVNPPGNERALQEELKAMLEEAGYECELLAAEPERPNLIARLRGDADGQTLTLLGHVDTVRADPDEWSRDPWCGDLDDGWVWGRGALDMKGQVASELAACLQLGRSGWRPAAGELLLVLTADEEAGGDLGARWLCEQHPERVRSDLVVNEGGGVTIEHDGRRLYTLSVGEKGIFRVRVKVTGRAGHASLPKIGDNALLKLAPLLTSLSEQPPPEPTSEGLAFLSALYGEPVEGEAGMRVGLERLGSDQPLLAAFLAEPMLSVTLSPTKARAGEKANVIPSAAEALIDCRVPPGLDADDARERIESLLGEGEYELEFTEAVVGNRSPFESGLLDAVRGWLAESDPGAELAPIVMPGFSDSHWFREAFDSAVVYGFCPHREISLLEAAPLIHGADERVPAADIELAASFFFDLPRRLLS